MTSKKGSYWLRSVGAVALVVTGIVGSIALKENFGKSSALVDFVTTSANDARVIMTAQARADERASRVCTIDGWCSAIDAVPDVTLFAVDATNRNDVWAVGAGGVVLHWNGRNWGGWLGLGGAAVLQAVRVFSPQDVWVAGRNAEVLHFDGRAWKTESVPALTFNNEPVSANRLVGTCADDLWLMRELGPLLRRQSGKWVAPSPPFQGLSESDSLETNSLISLGPGEVWLSGNGVARSTADGFQTVTGNGWDEVKWSAMQRLSDGTVAVARPDGIGIYTARERVARLPAPDFIRCIDLAGNSASDLWLRGDGRQLTHWNGSLWQREDGAFDVHAIAVAGDHTVIAVGARSELRILGPLPDEHHAESNVAYQDLAFLPAQDGSAARSLLTVGTSSVAKIWRSTHWETLQLPREAAATNTYKMLAASPHGGVDMVTTLGIVFHADAASPTDFSARKHAPSGYWIAVAQDGEGRTHLLSTLGEVQRWDGDWVRIREPSASEGNAYGMMQFDKAGNLYLLGFDKWQNARLPSVAVGHTNGSTITWESLFPKQADFDECRSPRGNLMRSMAGELIASAGTEARPCLLQQTPTGFRPLLVQYLAGAHWGEPAHGPYGDMVVVHGGDRESPEHKPYIAGLGAQGFWLYPAPLPRVTAAALDPETQRAWLIGNGDGKATFLLDYAREEFRGVIPTLTLAR